MDSNPLVSAAERIRRADAILISAGAGMGVDSGLPDFRGPEGFWRAYPALRGLRFEEMSTPSWFHIDQTRAWGFFGHRLELYRRTHPHIGFEILLRLIKKVPLGGFVVTSNVDGQFQKAGFDDQAILEVHGTIHQLQCTRPCCEDITSYDTWTPDIDEANVRCLNEPPLCARCGRIARPNILMFNDGQWLSHRSDEQAGRFQTWLQLATDSNLVVIELGAGKAVTTIRSLSESLLRAGRQSTQKDRSVTLIRINPRDPDGPPGCVSISAGALEALTQLDHILCHSS
ncbi:MAG: Sir2 family NAD-dependent protein deacetylase [Pirellulales bacterium]